MEGAACGEREAGEPRAPGDEGNINFTGAGRAEDTVRKLVNHNRGTSKGKELL